MSMFIGKNIEVVFLNPYVQSIGILIHLQCKPTELATPETQSLVQQYVRWGIEYLKAEGFVPEEIEEWKLQVGGITKQK